MKHNRGSPVEFPGILQATEQWEKDADTALNIILDQLRFDIRQRAVDLAGGSPHDSCVVTADHVRKATQEIVKQV